MNLGNFLIVKSLISLVFAFAYLLVPGTAASWFGMALDPTGILLARMLGAVFLGIGFICWFTSQVSDTSLGRDIVLALFLADTVGFLVTLLAQLSPIAAASGWVGVAIWLLLAAGLGYFRFVR